MCVYIRSSSFQETVPRSKMETTAPDFPESKQNSGLYKTSAICFNRQIFTFSYSIYSKKEQRIIKLNLNVRPIRTLLMKNFYLNGYL